MENRFVVKTPIGYLVFQEKGNEDDYPGVFISLSETGEEFEMERMVACVEYGTDSGEILVETYSDEIDDPTHIIRHSDGEDIY